MGYNNTDKNRGKDNRRDQGKQYFNPPTADTGPMKLPDDYVQEAENLMRNRRNITSSKIRSIMSLVSEIYNTENIRTEESLLQESCERIQMMRVRILYEAGRDSAVKQFIEECHLINYIKGIGNNRKNFIYFARYMEALVAYHKYFGGRD
jgi:CRISPR-associated protein Csm2